MRKLIYTIIIFLISGIWLSSCKTSRNMDIQKQVDYSSDLLFLKNSIELLRTEVNKQTKITSAKLSNLLIENKTIDLSPPDSAGKQYLIRESITKASKQEQEKIDVDEIIELTLQQFSKQLNGISDKMDVFLNQKEKVVELSWWDLNQNKVYISITCLIIIGWLIYRLMK